MPLSLEALVNLLAVANPKLRLKQVREEQQTKNEELLQLAERNQHNAPSASTSEYQPSTSLQNEENFITQVSFWQVHDAEQNPTSSCIEVLSQFCMSHI